MEEIHAYIYYKFTTIGDNDIHRDMNLVYNNELSFKQGIENLEVLNVTRNMFYTEFENHE